MRTKGKPSKDQAVQGDSGGPLSVVDQDPETGEEVWSLAGITSWGPNSCGEKYQGSRWNIAA